MARSALPRSASRITSSSQLAELGRLEPHEGSCASGSPRRRAARRSAPCLRWGRTWLGPCQVVADCDRSVVAEKDGARVGRPSVSGHRDRGCSIGQQRGAPARTRSRARSTRPGSSYDDDRPGTEASAFLAMARAVERLQLLGHLILHAGRDRSWTWVIEHRLRRVHRALPARSGPTRSTPELPCLSATTGDLGRTGLGCRSSTSTRRPVAWR